MRILAGAAAVAEAEAAPVGGTNTSSVVGANHPLLSGSHLFAAERSTALPPPPQQQLPLANHPAVAFPVACDRAGPPVYVMLASMPRDAAAAAAPDAAPLAFAVVVAGAGAWRAQQLSAPLRPTPVRGVPELTLADLCADNGSATALGSLLLVGQAGGRPERRGPAPRALSGAGAGASCSASAFVPLSPAAQPRGGGCVETPAASTEADTQMSSLCETDQAAECRASEARDEHGSSGWWLDTPVML